MDPDRRFALTRMSWFWPTAAGAIASVLLNGCDNCNVSAPWLGTWSISDSQVMTQGGCGTSAASIDQIFVNSDQASGDATVAQIAITWQGAPTICSATTTTRASELVLSNIDCPGGGPTLTGGTFALSPYPWTDTAMEVQITGTVSGHCPLTLKAAAELTGPICPGDADAGIDLDGGAS